MSPSKQKFTSKGTLRQVFIRVYRLWYSQLCWYFRPSFVNCRPSNLLYGSTLPPPPPLHCVSLWRCGTVLCLLVVLVDVVVVSSLVSMWHCAVSTCGTGPCCGCLVSCVDVSLHVLFLPVVLVHVVVVSSLVSMWHCAVYTCGTGPCCGCLVSCVDVALCCLYLWYWSML